MILQPYRRLVRRLGHQRWFAFALRQLGGARLDAWLYRRSRGRLSIAGPALFPVLLLTTTGRRTGRPRTTPSSCSSPSRGAAEPSTQRGRSPLPDGRPQVATSDTIAVGPSRRAPYAADA